MEFELDTGQYVVRHTIAVGHAPVGLAYDGATNSFLVVDSSDAAVTVIDPADFAVTAMVGVGASPSGIAVDPSHRAAYVTNSSDGTTTDLTTLLRPITQSVAPRTGPVAGGTTVTLNGARFLGAASVSFGGVSARQFTVVSDGKIVAVSPAHAAGRVDVVVATLDASANRTVDHFTYR